MTLVLEINTQPFDALMADRQAYLAFRGWIAETPPLEHATRLAMLDESGGTTFTVRYFVTDELGNFILDDPMPCQGIHPIDYQCERCAARRVREAETVITTSRPIPHSALRYFSHVKDED